jgi:hypothetical protein
LPWRCPDPVPLCLAKDPTSESTLRGTSSAICGGRSRMNRHREEIFAGPRQFRRDLSQPKSRLGSFILLKSNTSLDAFTVACSGMGLHVLVWNDTCRSLSGCMGSKEPNNRRDRPLSDGLLSPKDQEGIQLEAMASSLAGAQPKASGDLRNIEKEFMLDLESGRIAYALLSSIADEILADDPKSKPAAAGKRSKISAPRTGLQSRRIQQRRRAAQKPLAAKIAQRARRRTD